MTYPPLVTMFRIPGASKNARDPWGKHTERFARGGGID
jgi:hypothetical protein